MGDHAKFSPSKMQRIIACPGSVALESALPDKHNDYADEGTVAHDIGAHCLRSETDAAEFIGREAKVDASGAVHWVKGGKFKIDQEFADYVQVYVDAVRRLAYGKILLVEQRVEFSETVGVPKQFGTSDAIVIDLETGTVYIIDLKFGVGVKVWASSIDANGKKKGNEQLLTYGVGARETFSDLLEGVDKFVFVISQPRIDHYDTYECGIAEMDAHTSTIRNAILCATVAQKDYDADRALDANFFKAGEKQCTFCKAKGFCPTYASLVADVVFEDLTALDEDKVHELAARPPVRVPGPSVIGARYGVLDMIEDWCKGVRAECERMVLGGMEVIGPDGLPMRLADGKKGNRKWLDEKDAEAALVGLVPKDKLYKTEIMTPAAAGTFFGEKRKTPSPHWADIQKLYTQAAGKPTVVLGSDPRPPYSGEMKDVEFEAIPESVE